MLFDTIFLIDLHREAKRSMPGAAMRFLEDHPDTPMWISVVTFAEFAEGFPRDQEALCARLLRGYRVVEVNQDIAWIYARASRQLRGTGSPLGDNDLWIAATAVHHSVELVTRDLNHFKRIEGLSLVEY